MNQTYVEIDLEKIGKNAQKIIHHYPKYQYYIGVLKSHAYGHGEYIVKELVKNGINYIAVSYLEEALEIRKYDKTIPILCLQPVSLSKMEEVIQNKITITVTNISFLEKLCELHFKEKIKIHLKLDTGMKRLGFQTKKEFMDSVSKIEACPFLELEGIYSHFATTGIFDKHWDDQVKKFEELTEDIDLHKIPIVHLASSVILLSHPKLSFCNGVRLGILLYGYNVSPIASHVGLKNKLRNFRNHYYQKKYHISKTIFNVKLDVQPAMKFITHFIEIKNIQKNEVVGYGATYKAKEDMKIGILPIGYHNGIGPSNDGMYVLVNGKKQFVIGTIGMNMTMVHLTEEVNFETEVIVLGDEITLGQMSRFRASSLSDTLLNIGNRNQRVYKRNRKIEWIEK